MLWKKIDASFELFCKERGVEEAFICKSFCAVIKKILSKLVDQKSNELYYAEYYSEVVNKSTEYFPLLKDNEAPLLAIIVCEKLMTEVQSVAKLQATSVLQINDRDRQCIGYIGGSTLLKHGTSQ